MRFHFFINNFCGDLFPMLTMGAATGELQLLERIKKGPLAA